MDITNVGYAVTAYAAYLAITIVMTVWVARTLFTHGRAFLIDAFTGDEALADSINHLLVVGFYLVNLGIICLNLTLNHTVSDPASLIESLATKVGIVLLVLGGMHLVNLVGLHKIRRSRLEPMPPRPNQYVPAPWMAPPPAPAGQ